MISNPMALAAIASNLGLVIATSSVSDAITGPVTSRAIMAALVGFAVGNDRGFGVAYRVRATVAG